jgi:hypothetical protein
MTRQSKIIEEQGALVQRHSSHLWEYQLLLIAPLYYGQPGLRRRRATGSANGEPESQENGLRLDTYEAAVERYWDNVIDSLK